MGKEAKIGLAVILALLVTFGVVLTRRVLTDDDRPATAAADEDGKAKTAGDKDSAAEDKAKSPNGNGKPTVLAANVGSGKVPAGSYDPLQGWNARPSGTATQQRATSGQTGTSQSMMANPARPETANTYPLYGGTQQTTQSTPAQQTGSATAADSAPYDPFQRGTASTGTAQVGQSDDTVRLLTRPTATQRQTAAAGYPYADQAGQTNHTAGKAPLPGYGQTAAQRYPQTIRQGMPARQVGIYGDGSDYTQRYNETGYHTEGGQYKVRPNESYWTISEKFYGTGAYFKALAEHNRSAVAQDDRLDYGDVIAVPGIEELEKEYPGLCPKASRRETLRNRASAVSLSGAYRGGRTYVVEEGDTLSDIARYELGKLSRWPEILELNRDVIGDDPDYLTPGLELALPDAGSADTITRHPGDGTTFQR